MLIPQELVAGNFRRLHLTFTDEEFSILTGLSGLILPVLFLRKCRDQKTEVQ